MNLDIFTLNLNYKMKNRIKFATLIFSVSILFCCKDNKRYITIDNEQNNAVPTTKKFHPNLQSDTTVVDVITIKKPENGTSLEALFSNKESFFNNSIIVKGKVTKVNNGILDRNWIHISDGTQFEGKKSLTVTTQESANIGDIVTFKGTVILNKDFGHGYIYDILLEQGNLIAHIASDQASGH